jgi:hypothetical protein
MLKTMGWLAAKTGYIVLFFLVAVGSAFADIDLPVAGSTNGQFYDGLLGIIPLGSAVAGLQFAGTTFGPTTGPEINLGTFRLSSSLAVFNPFDFKLSVNFTTPTVNATVFQADLTGAVLLGRGAATVNFANNVRHLDFGSGSFDLHITDVVVANGSSASIVGTISNAKFATTPEPASIVLTSALLGGLLIVFRKRLRGC